MNKLLCLLLIIIPLSAFSQPQVDPSLKKNIIYLSLQPVDLGVGLRYDRKVADKYALYGSVAYGNFRADDEYIKDHVKFAFGAMKFSKSKKGFFLAGVNAHTFGDSYYNKIICEKAFQPVSWELGVGVIERNFCLSIRFDFSRGESAVDFGFRF